MLAENPNNVNPPEAARLYLDCGWQPIPMSKGSKIPTLEGWQKLRLTTAELPTYFNKGTNVGLLLGELSGGLLDVDLDCEEAQICAKHFLPPTDMVHGRQSAPRTHYWYKGDTDIGTRRFQDRRRAKEEGQRDNATIVELRGSGAQTVAPPSLHPSGEAYLFDKCGEPAQVPTAILQRAVALIASAALLARYWPRGARQDAALALAGGLGRAGWSVEEVRQFLAAIAEAANDEELRMRLAAADYTDKRLQAGGQATGWPRFAELMGADVVDTVRNWLGIRQRDVPPGERRSADQEEASGSEQQESKKAGKFALTRLVDLLAEPEQEIRWIAEGLLPAGGISIMAAKPKVGKSTLARNLCFALARGMPFLRRATSAGPVVYLALEEKRSEVKRHFARMGASDDPIYIHVGSAPEAALEALRVAIADHQPRLAVVDPVLKLVRLRDANDYAEVSRAFEPLIDLARDSDCHILCLHHLSKGERAGGEGILGSTALYGAVDTALILKRTSSGRTVESIQRYGDDMPETVLTMDVDTGVVSAAGELSALHLTETAAQIMKVLSAQEAPLTETDIREQVEGDNTRVSKALRSLVDAGKIKRTGAGKKNDPYLYSIASDVTAD